MPRPAPVLQKGFAVRILLLVIALLSTVAVAMASSLTRDDGRAQKLSDLGLAGTVLRQAATLQGIAGVAVADGTAPQSLTWDVGYMNSLFRRASQLPSIPLEALDRTVPGAGWGSSPIAQIVVPGVGTDAADSVFIASGLKKEVCELVNQRLTGTPAISALSSGHPANQQSGCFLAGNGALPRYDFYVVYGIN